MTSNRRLKRRRGIAWTITAIVLALIVVGVFAGVQAITGLKKQSITDQCVAPYRGVDYTLDLGQSRNAAIIAGISVNRGLPAHAATIALATAMQESKLRNLSYGHADSLGLFQQRPSQGWGNKKQIQNPIYAANKFYEALTKVKNYQTIPVTQAAQKVQHSAYPDAYARHEKSARAFASSLTGNSPAGINCTMKPLAQSLSGSEKVAQVGRIERDAHAELGVSAAPGSARNSDGTYQARYRATGDTAASRRKQEWNVAAWAVASAYSLDITEISVPGHVWKRSESTDGWVKADSKAPGAVITVG